MAEPQIRHTNVPCRAPTKHKKQAHAPCARAGRPPRETRTLLKQRALLAHLVAPLIRPFWSSLKPVAQVVCSRQLRKCGATLSASLRRGRDEKRTCNVEWSAMKRNKGAAYTAGSSSRKSLKVSFVKSAYKWRPSCPFCASDQRLVMTLYVVRRSSLLAGVVEKYRLFV